MTISVEIIQGLGRRITVTITAENIKIEIQKRITKIAKKIRIDGFRKGKVPIQIISQRYNTTICQDVLNELMANKFIDIVREKNIKLAGTPNYIPGTYIKGKDFTYSVEFEIYPELNIQDIDTIEIEKPIVKITETDIDNMLITLQKQYATWQETKTAVTKNDRVLIDFTGKVEDKELEDCTATDFVLNMDKNNMPFEFTESIVSRKAGEKFTVNLKFPNNYIKNNLRNKDVKFDITLKKVETCKLPELNPELIKNFGVKDGSILSLRNEVRKNMERELKIAIRQNLKTQVIKELIKKNNIQVIPKVLINKEIEELRRQAVVAQHKNEKKIMELPYKAFKEQAQSRVIIKLLLNELIHVNNLKVNKNRVKELIEEIASVYENPQKIINLYNKNDILMNKIHNLVLEEQAIKAVLLKAKVTDKTISFHDLLTRNFSA